MIRSLIIAASVILFSCAGGPQQSLPKEGVSVRFIIERASGSGNAVNRNTYENSVLMASGNTFSHDFPPMFGVTLSATDAGANARVTFELRDLMRNGVVVGSTSADIPMNGQTTVTLPKADGFTYSVVLKASRRPLPAS